MREGKGRAPISNDSTGGSSWLPFRAPWRERRRVVCSGKERALCPVLALASPAALKFLVPWDARGVQTQQLAFGLGEHIMIRNLALATIAVITAMLPARAQSPVQSSTRPGGELAAVSGSPGAVPDALFAAAAGAGGLAEVNVSEIGLQRATDPELKQFSQRMIDDHSKVNQELANLTMRKGMRIPVGIDSRAQFCAESLSGLSGEEFNRCYAKAQLVMHMDAVSAFEAEAHRGQDPDIKALAARTLPVIKEHLKAIKPIAMRYEKAKSEDQATARAGHAGSSR